MVCHAVYKAYSCVWQIFFKRSPLFQTKISQLCLSENLWHDTPVYFSKSIFVCIGVRVWHVWVWTVNLRARACVCVCVCVCVCERERDRERERERETLRFVILVLTLFPWTPPPPPPHVFGADPLSTPHLIFQVHSSFLCKNLKRSPRSDTSSSRNRSDSPHHSGKVRHLTCLRVDWHWRLAN